MMLNELVLSYFLQKFDMEVAPWTLYGWLTEATRNRELIYSSQKSTKIFGRKVVENWLMPKNGASTRKIGRKVGIAPKSTKKNGRWRHLKITILERYLTTQWATNSPQWLLPLTVHYITATSKVFRPNTGG